MVVDGINCQISNLWEEVLARCDIRFRKRKTGVLVALCPFHNEKTPSVKFWPRTGGFKCYGCGASGDKLRFVLAQRFGWVRSGELSSDELKDALEDIPWILSSLGGHMTYPDQGTLQFPFVDSLTQGPAAEK